MFICIADGKQQYVWPNFTQLWFYISPFYICLCFKMIGCIKLIRRLTHFNLTVFWQWFIHHKLFTVLTTFQGAEQKSKVPFPTLMQDRVRHMRVGVYIAAGADWGRGQECDLAQKQKTPESCIATKKFGVRQSPSESRKKEQKHHSWAVIDLAPGCLSLIRSVKSPQTCYCRIHGCVLQISFLYFSFILKFEGPGLEFIFFWKQRWPAASLFFTLLNYSHAGFISIFSTQ